MSIVKNVAVGTIAAGSVVVTLDFFVPKDFERYQSMEVVNYTDTHVTVRVYQGRVNDSGRRRHGQLAMGPLPGGMKKRVNFTAPTYFDGRTCKSGPVQSTTWGLNFNESPVMNGSPKEEYFDLEIEMPKQWFFHFFHGTGMFGHTNNSRMKGAQPQALAASVRPQAVAVSKPAARVASPVSKLAQLMETASISEVIQALRVARDVRMFDIEAYASI